MIEEVNITLRGLELEDVNGLMKYWNKIENRRNILDKVPQSKEKVIE